MFDFAMKFVRYFAIFSLSIGRSLTIFVFRDCKNYPFLLFCYHVSTIIRLHIDDAVRVFVSFLGFSILIWYVEFASLIHSPGAAVRHYWFLRIQG